MDAINYLNEDCSYTSERVDGWLTIFWHPEDVSRPVGFRLKGIRHIFLKVRQLKAASLLTEADFFSVIRILEVVVAAWGDELLDQAEKAARYSVASTLAREVRLPREDFDQIVNSVPPVAAAVA
jgi:hypothetical protein